MCVVFSVFQYTLALDCTCTSRRGFAADGGADGGPKSRRSGGDGGAVTPVLQNRFIVHVYRGVPPGKIDPFLIDVFVLGAQPFCSVKKTVQLMPEVGGRSIRMHHPGTYK